MSVNPFFTSSVVAACVRGPSPEQDQRQLELLEERRGAWRWADDLSSGGAEVLFLSLPGLVVLVNSGYRPAEVSFAAVVGLVVVSVGVTARSRWTRADPPWPDWRVATFLFRIGYYSVTMLLLGFVGGFVTATIGTLPAVGVVTTLGAGAVVALPYLLVATRTGVARLRRWHAWLFGP